MDIKKYTPRILIEEYPLAIKNRKDVEFLLEKTITGEIKNIIPNPKNYINFFNHKTTVTFHDKTVMIHTVLSPTISLIFLFIAPFIVIYLLFDSSDFHFRDVFVPLLIITFSTYLLFIHLVELTLTSIREYIYRSLYLKKFNKYLGETEIK